MINFILFGQQRFLNIEKKIYKLLLNLLYLYFLHALQAHDFFTDQTSYKRCRRRIVTRGSVEGPAAGTPPSARWQQDLSSDFDTVRQRLELDSPPRTQAEHEGLQGNPPSGRQHATHVHPTHTCRFCLM